MAFMGSTSQPSSIGITTGMGSCCKFTLDTTAQLHCIDWLDGVTMLVHLTVHATHAMAPAGVELLEGLWNSVNVGSLQADPFKQ